MSETKLVSPLLDGFTLGNPISNHSGICCCPAMKENSDNRYIVKIIAVPASQTQLDALLVTGAYKDPAAALDYFREQADGIAAEAELLKKLSRLEGFLPYEGWQVAPMKKNRLGYHVYLVGEYRRSLEKFLRRHAITHLEAVNLGLDICSALAMCRQAGYLYIDLKPTNVFVGEDKTFRIGDLGFAPLDSLKYMSMPEKYCSDYCAPEAHDSMCTLNDTMDTYALGMMLYRIYNSNTLPTVEAGQPLPAPALADEEMAQIILKACAPNPEDRWKDPSEMGQALVAYMQSGSVSDAPISAEEARQIAAVSASQDTVRFVPGETAVDPDELPEEKPDLEKTIMAPESFQEAVSQAQTMNAPAEEPAVPEEPVSQPTEEAPVPQPEPEAPVDSFDLDSELNEVNSLLGSQPEVTAPRKDPTKLVTPTPVVMGKKRHSGKGLLVALLVLLLLAAIGFCGYGFYQFYYLKTVEDLSISGTQSKMTVTLKTDVEDSLLSVSCTDVFGNVLRQNVKNKQAEFTDLSPDSLYKVAVEISGIHKLTGKTSDVFTTESQTEIVSLSAVTGQEDGSVLLTLTVHGHEPDSWKVVCSAEGEADISETFTGHSATVKGLTVGKHYTITVSAEDGSELMGKNSIEFTASGVISAGNLAVISRINGELTVCWEEPKDHPVEEWAVRCYGEDYDQSQAVTGTLAIFGGTEDSKAYTIEVTAAGMTQPTRTTVSAFPVTVTSLTVDDSTSQQLNISWSFDGQTPKEGWLLLYTMDGSDISNVVKCSNATALISPRVPGASYQFTIQTADSTSVFNGVHNYRCPAGEPFVAHAISADKITAKLLETPADADWSADNIDRSAFTNVFSKGQKISMVLEAGVSFYLDHEDVSVLYVIRDADGKVLPNLVEQVRTDWHDLWVNGDYHFCELNIPNVPENSGSYRIDLYFNGSPVVSESFTIR